MIQNKKLGIQQRIPLYVLGEALKSYTKERTIDEQAIKQMLRADYAGENRIQKSFNQIKSVIINSPLTTFVDSHLDEIHSALDNNSDKPLILTALICGRYHFCYQVAKMLAKQFRQQDVIPSQLLDKLIADVYGFNKSTQNSRNCAVPQMIEAGLLLRNQSALYEQAETIAPNHQITIDLWKEAFFANEELYDRSNEEDLYFEPFFRYIKFV